MDGGRRLAQVSGAPLGVRQRLSAFGVGMGQRAPALMGRIIAGGRLRADRYRGAGAVELFVERLIDLSSKQPMA
jgi:hypothetical protein